MTKIIDHFSRAQILALYGRLGGQETKALTSALASEDDEALLAVIAGQVRCVNDIAKLDAELCDPLTLDLRAWLMARRIDLANSNRRSAEADRFQQGRRLAQFEINIPQEVGISHLQHADGSVSVARATGDGGRVIDATPNELRAFLAGPHGLLWQTGNGEAIQRLAIGDF